MKVSIVIPVYCNEDTLEMLYADLKEKIFDNAEYQYEIIMVNDGSKDKSYEIMEKMALEDRNIKIVSLSRNFGSHAAILCGLSKVTGDCAIIKAADLQEPSTLILEMIGKWKEGNNVVLAVREDRNESKKKTVFANLYYGLTRKIALPNMPKGGFDVYLLDKKVINVLMQLDEKNSALTGQILWAGFKTGIVKYTRLARTVGESKWTFKKKMRLVKDTVFSFSILPITMVNIIGVFSFIGSIIWAAVVLIFKIAGKINVSGWSTLFIFNLFAFGIIMLTLGVIGEYLWRTFDASRNRPPYIVEEEKQSK